MFPKRKGMQEELCFATFISRNEATDAPWRNGLLKVIKIGGNKMKRILSIAASLRIRCAVA
jgi:hypothetical protein